MARILLIDDDNDYRSMVRMWLEKSGHEVDEARDTESWVTLYSQNSYDLVITDLFMPQIDGVQAIRMMRKEFNSPKIIAMTGGSSDGTLEYLLNLAKECGATDTYKKTDHINELLSKVAILL